MLPMSALAPLRASLARFSRQTTTTTTTTLRSLRLHCRMTSTLPRLPIFEALAKHDPQSPAAVHSGNGQTFSYSNLLHDVSRARDQLRDVAQGKTLDGQRVGFLIESSYDYVVTFLSVLASNAVAVPMAPSFPASELRYIVNQAQAAVLLASPKTADKAKEVLQEDIEGDLPAFHQITKLEPSTSSEPVSITDLHASDQAGLMLYTSGTTSRPKGVLLPNAAITAQAHSLIQAWDYSPKDRLLHILPLHHIHGTINALLTPLFAGSTIEFAFPFQPDTVWRRFAAPFLPNPAPQHAHPITFFTVVPTIYARLQNTFKDLPEDVATAAKKGISPSSLRLNISGSAALPTPTKQAWTDLSSGNVLLERYGMTEVGMALSCGLDNADRVDGSVGWPLPSVQVRLVDTETNEVIHEGQETDAEGKERQGEIQLRGPTIFKEYWRNEQATAAEHVDDADGQGRWFKTGDVAIRRNVPTAGQNKKAQPWASGPMYFIQGRKSADIIKSGGEKVSALEVEREMLSLPQVSECAVVGLPSPQWGQKVSAVVVLTEEGKTAGKGGKPWSPLQMRQALKERLVNYKVPQEMKVVESIPRNAMGKINKKQLIKDIWPDVEG